MNRNRLQKLGDFVLGKGFYIVLFLCVAAMGISGYYLVRSVNGSDKPTQPVTANPNIVLPDSSANRPVPRPEVKPRETPAPKEDPQPVKEPIPQEQSPQKKDVVYTWPVKGEILRGFSLETLAYDPTMGDWRTHSGTDIAAEAGWNVLAAGEGSVVEVFDHPMMGTTVIIQQPDGVVSTYSNLAPAPAVAVGDSVDTGTVLGTIGETAIAESGLPAHLHLEMSRDGEPLDPLTLLPQ